MAKGDVGVGTIVGSAVFNIVCVIGVCGLFVNEVSVKYFQECHSLENMIFVGYTIDLVVGALRRLIPLELSFISPTHL